jgi:hypothetical protein
MLASVPGTTSCTTSTGGDAKTTGHRHTRHGDVRNLAGRNAAGTSTVDRDRHVSHVPTRSTVAALTCHLA